MGVAIVPRSLAAAGIGRLDTPSDQSIFIIQMKI